MSSVPSHHSGAQGGILRVASIVAEVATRLKLLLLVGGAPGCAGRACPAALGGLLEIAGLLCQLARLLGCAKSCRWLLALVPVCLHMGLRVLRGRALRFALRVGGGLPPQPRGLVGVPVLTVSCGAVEASASAVVAAASSTARRMIHGQGSSQTSYHDAGLGILGS